MKMTKRWLSVLLCVIMAVTVFTVTASAAGGATNVAFAVEKTEVNVGDTFTVTLSNKAMTVTGFSAGFAFDKELLECVSIAGPNPGMPTMYYLSMNYSGMAFPVVATAVSTVDEANANGTVGFAYIGTADTAYLEGVLFTVTFRAKAAGTASFTLYEESNGTDAFKSDSIETKTLTIKEAAPACDHENTKAVSNGDGATHKLVCTNEACGETVTASVPCSGGMATCTAKAVCTECGQSYGELDPDNHTSNEVTYKNVTATTHDEYHKCCDTLKEENVTHTYKGDEHKCDCGAEETRYYVNMNYNGGVDNYSQNYNRFYFYLDEEGITLARNILTNTPGKVTYAGYVFAGWTTVQNDASTKIEIATWTPTVEETTLYALWECAHSNMTHVPAVTANCQQGGNSEYWSCSCGKFYSDANATTEIAENSWVLGRDENNHKNTYVADGSHLDSGDSAYHYQWLACSDCTNKTIKQVNREKHNDENGDGNHDCDKCGYQNVTVHTGGTPTCTAKAVCTECGQSYGELDPDNHTSTKLNYTNNGDTHSATYDCCGGSYVTGEAHNYTYDATAHKCICGAVEKFTLTFVVEGNTFWTVTGQYNTFVDYTNMPATDDRFGYTFAWDTTLPETFNEHATITGEYTAMNGWTQVSNAWYYFTNGVPAKGLTRVPYNTELGHEPNAEDVAYAEGKGETYVNETTALYLFDENGKLVRTTGIKDGKYYQDGIQLWHPGLVVVDNELYYFAGDAATGGNKLANGIVWVTRTNDVTDLEKGACYLFENGKVKADFTGIESGKYFENGKYMIGAGLVQIGEDFYYVRSSGAFATGKYYITNTNGLKGFTTGMKLYFDEDGKMLPIKNGIVDGYYYVNNSIQCGAGLIEYKGAIYYVRSSGKVATGTYYITNTNGMEGFKANDKLLFGEDGKLIVTEKKDGIVEEGGALYYYENGRIAYNAGLLEIENGVYIYVRSNGQLAIGEYYVTNVNGLEGFEVNEKLIFGSDGKLTAN